MGASDLSVQLISVKKTELLHAISFRLTLDNQDETFIQPCSRVIIHKLDIAEKLTNRTK